jgi:hypothetical protein
VLAVPLSRSVMTARPLGDVDMIMHRILDRR